VARAGLLFLLLLRPAAAAPECSLNPQLQLEERFAVLYGRSFHSCAALGPSLRLVLRGTSLDEPSPMADDSASDIELIYSALPGSGSTTLGQVTKAISGDQLHGNAGAASFLINYLTAGDRDAYLRANRGSLSMSQIVAVAQYLGYLADQRHDWGKTRTLDRPVLTPEQVTNAAEAELKGVDPNLLAGDCADVANAQGDLLQKLGARDVVVVTSSLVTGLHSTVMARDPAQKQSYFHFNLGLVTHSAAREGADLLALPLPDASWTDIGAGVYLNRPNGATVAWVPTNAGKIFAEAAGMNIQEIEPLARATSSLAGAQVELPWGQSLQLFAARDSQGSWYSGLALRQVWAQAKAFPGAVGLVTSLRNTFSGLTAADFYLQIEQGAATPTVHAGDWLRARIFDANLIIIGSYTLPFDATTDEVWGFGAAMLLNLGTQVALSAPRFPVAAGLRAEVQLAPGVTNIAGATPTVFVNHGLIAGDARARLPHQVTLMVGGEAVFDFFGTRLAAGIGVETPRFGVRLEAIGRAVEDSAAYKEGSLRRGRLLGGVTILRGFALSVMGEVQESVGDPRWIISGAIEGRIH
jgi:hypothetical protein